MVNQTHPDLLTVRSDAACFLVDLTPRLRSRIRTAALNTGVARLTSAHPSVALAVSTRIAVSGPASRFSNSVTVPIDAGDLRLPAGTAVIAAVLDGPKFRGLRLEILSLDEAIPA